MNDLPTNASGEICLFMIRSDLSNTSKPKIVICGATGNQGRMVTRALLASGRWAVTALSRDPSSAAALELGTFGAQVVQADTNDLQSLLKVFSGAYGVFGVTQPWSSEKAEYNISKEITQGKNILWACKETDIKHLVLSTFLNFSGKPTDVNFIDSKLILEKTAVDLNIPHTVIRPGLYMENILRHFGGEAKCLLKGNYPSHLKIPYISLKDIGDAVDKILSHPDHYIGRQINLFSETVSGEEIAAILSKETGHACQYRPVNPWMVRWSRPEVLALGKYLELLTLNGNIRNDDATELLLTLDSIAGFLHRHFNA